MRGIVRDEEYIAIGSGCLANYIDAGMMMVVLVLVVVDRDENYHFFLSSIFGTELFIIINNMK